MPHEWVTELDTPEEVVIEPVDVRKFRVPGAECKENVSIVEIKGTLGYPPVSTLCHPSRRASRRKITRLIQLETQDINEPNQYFLFKMEEICL